MPLARRRWIPRTVALTALLLAIATTAVVVARATAPPPPLTTHRLADSLASEVSAAEEAFCTREQRGRWSCDVVDESGQRLAAYDVDAASRSCWRATRTTHRPDGPATAGRCLD